MKKVIDCYGNFSFSEKYQKTEKRAYIIDGASDTVTYVAFSSANVPQPIHRITKTDTVTEIVWAVGLWANRANLDYVTDLNTSLEIEDTEE